jgi:hypothetical protein
MPRNICWGDNATLVISDKNILIFNKVILRKPFYYCTTMKMSFFKIRKMTILKKTLLNRLKKEESDN